MMNYILNLIDVKYKVLIQNFISLFILQGLNYILPLITVPYLVRVLGPEKYGITIFAAAFMIYFQIFTDYGFNLTATRNISLNKSDKNKVGEIFSSVMTIKAVLCALSFFVMIILVFSISKFRIDYQVYMFAFIMVVGNALFPVWLFQGMEQMKYITYVNIIVKSVFTIIIFVIVRNPDDYMKLVILNSSSAMVVGIVSLILAIKKYKIKFFIPPINAILKELKEGWHIFVTSMLSTTLTTSGIFILGLFGSKEIVGYYGAVDKLVKAFIGLFTPITQAIFPHINTKFKISYECGRNEVLKFGKYVMLMALIISSCMFIFHRPIVLLVCSSKYASYSYILKYMSIWLLISVLNNFIGVQFLIGTGKGAYYSKSFIISAGITLMLYLVLISRISYYGIVIGTIIGELTLTVVMLLFIKFKIHGQPKIS